MSLFPIVAPMEDSVATVTLTANSVDAVSANSFTFGSQSLGTAAGDRKIVVGIGAGPGTKAVDSVTVAGESATLVVAQIGVGETVEIWQIELAAGTTGDIVVDFVDGANQDACGIGVYAVYGAASAAHDTGGSSSADPATDTLNIPASGVAIGHVYHRTASTPDLYAWTGLTERFDETAKSSNSSYSGASDAFATYQTGLTIAAAAANAGFRAEVLAIASWAPTKTSACLPTDISGLQAWYKADAGITKDGGDQVSAWVDQSGNSLDLAQGTAADQPTWIDSRTNGLPAVHFDGTEHIDGATFASAITQPAHTFALVKKHSNTTGDRLIVTVPDGTTGPIYRDAGSGNISASNHIADGAVVNAGTSLYRLVSIVWNGTSTTNQLNIDTPVTSATNVSGNLVEVSLGGYSNGGNESDVDIAEYLVYDSEITGEELFQLQNYFKNRYALWA